MDIQPHALHLVWLNGILPLPAALNIFSLSSKFNPNEELVLPILWMNKKSLDNISLCSIEATIVPDTQILGSLKQTATQIIGILSSHIKWLKLTLASEKTYTPVLVYEDILPFIEKALNDHYAFKMLSEIMLTESRPAAVATIIAADIMRLYALMLINPALYVDIDIEFLRLPKSSDFKGFPKFLPQLTGANRKDLFDNTKAYVIITKDGKNLYLINNSFHYTNCLVVLCLSNNKFFYKYQHLDHILSSCQVEGTTANVIKKLLQIDNFETEIRAEIDMPDCETLYKLFPCPQEEEGSRTARKINELTDIVFSNYRQYSATEDVPKRILKNMVHELYTSVVTALGEDLLNSQELKILRKISSNFNMLDFSKFIQYVCVKYVLKVPYNINHYQYYVTAQQLFVERINSLLLVPSFFQQYIDAAHTHQVDRLFKYYGFKLIDKLYYNYSTIMVYALSFTAFSKESNNLLSQYINSNQIPEIFSAWHNFAATTKKIDKDDLCTWITPGLSLSQLLEFIRDTQKNDLTDDIAQRALTRIYSTCKHTYYPITRTPDHIARFFSLPINQQLPLVIKSKAISPTEQKYMYRKLTSSNPTCAKKKFARIVHKMR